MMDGRLKTLHPKIHGGLLGRRDTDKNVMQEHGIDSIDLLIVNLYPFETITHDPGCSLDKAIENIDIGGPTMLRAASKNHQQVAAVHDPKDYENIIIELKQHNNTLSHETRFELAMKVFSYTAYYDSIIARYLAKHNNNTVLDNPVHTIALKKKQNLRYGENPDQQAAFYQEVPADTSGICGCQQLQGKALSFNNIADGDAALTCVQSFAEHLACVIVKHANPCGVAIAQSALDAYQNALATDATSAFGGIIAFNTAIDEATAQELCTQFAEVIIAPDFSDKALTTFSQKPNLRLLRYNTNNTRVIEQLDYKKITGGVLIQTLSATSLPVSLPSHHPVPENLTCVTEQTPSTQILNDLLFAWKVVKQVKSNAIVLAKAQQTLGIGAGQMSRIDSVAIALQKAEQAALCVTGAVMASDAFFPFRDGIDTAVQQGITAIIQPGGSIRDQEVIAAANEAGISMVFTHHRQFKH